MTEENKKMGQIPKRNRVKSLFVKKQTSGPAVVIQPGSGRKSGISKE